MNPCENSLEFFNLKKSHPVPVIRMVFALASKTPCVTVIKSPERIQPPRIDAPKPPFKSDKYTAFDIWCSKASRETFWSIKDDATLEKLLLCSRVFPGVYENKKSESIQTRPGTWIWLLTCIMLIGSGSLDRYQQPKTFSRPPELDTVFFIPLYTPFALNKAIYNIQLRLNPLRRSVKCIRIFDICLPSNWRKISGNSSYCRVYQIRLCIIYI